MSIAEYAAPAATVAVAVVGAVAGRLTATRKTRELQHLKLLVETTKMADPTTMERGSLDAQLLYEVELYAARNSGGDRGTRIAIGILVGLGALVGLLFAGLTLRSLGDSPIDYGLTSALALPAVVSFVVAILYAGRFDRISKEIKVREKRDTTLEEISSKEKRLKFLRLYLPQSEIDKLNID